MPADSFSRYLYKTQGSRVKIFFVADQASTFFFNQHANIFNSYIT